MKKFNYEKIYNHKKIILYKKYCQNIITELFKYLQDLYTSLGNNYEEYKNAPIMLDQYFGHYLEKLKDFYEREKSAPEQIIVDYIAGMTDKFALDCMRLIKIPLPI
jgi:dGTPase